MVQSYLLLLYPAPEPALTCNFNARLNKFATFSTFQTPNELCMRFFYAVLLYHINQTT